MQSSRAICVRPRIWSPMAPNESTCRAGPLAGSTHQDLFVCLKRVTLMRHPLEANSRPGRSRFAKGRPAGGDDFICGGARARLLAGQDYALLYIYIYMYTFFCKPRLPRLDCRAQAREGERADQLDASDWNRRRRASSVPVRRGARGAAGQEQPANERTPCVRPGENQIPSVELPIRRRRRRR